MLPDESGGGVVDGLVESAGGGALCIEFEESAGGVAGAVDDESEGAFGDVDCCLEHATRANALRHNKRRLRFMKITSLYCRGHRPPRLLRSAGWEPSTLVSQAVFHPA